MAVIFIKEKIVFCQSFRYRTKMNYKNKNEYEGKHLIFFMFYFVDLNKQRKVSGQKDAYILIEESKRKNKEFKIRDSKDRSIYKIKLSIRNVGEKPNNPIKYF